MATALAQRQRSNTSTSASSSRAGKSRASTASIHSSASTQPAQRYHNEPDLGHQFQRQQQPSPYQQQTHPMQYTAEEMVSQNQRQLSNPHNPYGMDPSLQHEENLRRSMSVDPSHGSNADARPPPMGHRQSFDMTEHGHFHATPDEPGPDDTGTENGKNKMKKGSATSAANDLELKRLYAENKGRPLKEVANEVIVHERGPKSEKTKQIFAMLWLDTVCKKSTGSVPRNRVFSHYATRCGTERVPPLNPASFGKLVRIIFPGIQTRRLGMRGESKYHYVDLSLVDEQQAPVDMERRPVTVMRETTVAPDRPNLKRPRSQPPADSTLFPTPDEPYLSHPYNLPKRQKLVPGALLTDSTEINMNQNFANTHSVKRELKWPTTDEEPYREDESINLPDIYSYVPLGTDSDAANALTALYRSHCVSVIDCFRFCKEKMLWHHFTSFHGTLTVPVQKLLAHPDIAAWIKECDWLMYQNMVRFVAPLALQVVPHRVLDTFRAISNKLTDHIAFTFQNLPQHVRDAKLNAAIPFAGLLDRLLRVNATAHAAANMLTSDANREQMWQDWCLHVKPRKVVESALATTGFCRTLWILTRDVRNLLGPLQCISWEGMEGCYHKANREAPPDFSQHGHPEHNDSTEGVLDRWTEFLYSLPSQFPHADAREMIDRISQVCDAALRDITMAQALSFGSWWITKCWIDEMLMWIAEKGGFMEHSPDSFSIGIQRAMSDKMVPAGNGPQESLTGSRPQTSGSAAIDQSGNYGSAEVTQQQSTTQEQGNHHGHSHSLSQPPALLRANSFHPEPGLGTAPLGSRITREPLQRTKSANMITEMHGGLPVLDHHDDSGIGLGLDDDDLNMDKYHGFIADGLGSDPANISVC